MLYDNETADFSEISFYYRKKASDKFSIQKLNKNYLLAAQTKNFDLQNFRLYPETEYEIINHYNSDVVSVKLIIRTDKSSVIYANKTSCKQQTQQIDVLSNNANIFISHFDY